MTTMMTLIGLINNGGINKMLSNCDNLLYLYLLMDNLAEAVFVQDTSNIFLNDVITHSHGNSLM